MYQGTNTSVQIRSNVLSALDTVCRYHKVSKVNLISYIAAYLVSLHPDELGEILQQGKMINLILDLGGKADYPKGIEIPDGHIRKLLEKG